ncbi:hypothetical protein PRELSG_1102900 [Plasmodium relictum]|uniref:Uncharacterized protein n=1 Tax=Plasmodium relictum TaxID=85471 RepID=A0A1J1HB73_PLARL|nr:hypothetical protein PRELSG_1102900 [Plasmodium relictum]CRH00682.1 hypothetical protein PRELSG_1102900 [Plasmodium relictum]
MHYKNELIMKKGSKEKITELINKNCLSEGGCKDLKRIHIENIGNETQKKNYKQLIKKIEDINESDSKKNYIKNYTIYGDKLKSEKLISEKLYENIDQIKCGLISEKSIKYLENLKENKFNNQNYNNIEHYNIMSSTDPSLSSNNSITKMYETNYDYFTKIKDIKNELSCVPNSEINLITNYNTNKNNVSLKHIYLSNRNIKITGKSNENISVNLKKMNEKKILKDNENLHKYKDSSSYKSRYTYLNQTKGKIPTKKNEINFNPHTCNNRNIQINYDPTNKLFNKNITFFKNFSKMNNEETHKIKYMSKYKNYLKNSYNINNPYVKEKCMKKRNNCIFFRRYNSKNFKYTKSYYSPFIVQNLKKNQNIFNDIINYPYNKNTKYKNLSNNFTDYRPRKSKGSHKKITCKNKYIYAKNLFSKLMKKLRLLGYALFFCFFISNKTKTMKEKTEF